MTCARSPRGPRGAAFTLLELLIVLGILSILFFILTPRFISSLNPAQTKTFVQRLRNTLLYAGEKSVLSKKVYLFTMDLDERRYYFHDLGDGKPGGEGERPLPPPRALSQEASSWKRCGSSPANG